MKHAITVIGYQRLAHLSETLRCLSFNYEVQKCPLYIFIDGPKDIAKSSTAYKTYASICSFAKTFPWEGKKHLITSKTNKGLHKAVRFAIDTVLTDYPSIIIVEDDIVTSSYFYQYMKHSLTTYADQEQVGAVCSHCYPFSRKIFNPKEPYFLQHFSCWGWGTWRNVWEHLEWNSNILMQGIQKTSVRKQLDFGYGNQVSGILNAQHYGYINTWDVQVGVSLFLQKKLCLFPNQTLTCNIGWYGEKSTHMFLDIDPNAPLAFYKIPQRSSPAIAEEPLAHKAYADYFYPNKIKTYLGFLKRKGKSFMRKILKLPIKYGHYKQMQ